MSGTVPLNCFLMMMVIELVVFNISLIISAIGVLAGFSYCKYHSIPCYPHESIHETISVDGEAVTIIKKTPITMEMFHHRIKVMSQNHKGYVYCLL